MPWVPRRLQGATFASVTGEGGKRHTIIIWNSNDTCGGDIIVIQNAPLKFRGRDLEAFDLCSHGLSAVLVFASDSYITFMISLGAPCHQFSLCARRCNRNHLQSIENPDFSIPVDFHLVPSPNPPAVPKIRGMLAE